MRRLAPLLLALAGCHGLAGATQDRSSLQGDILPTGLGRRLDVKVEGLPAAPEGESAPMLHEPIEGPLVAALRNELESRDLFDLVEVAPVDSRGGAHRAARLDVRVVERTSEEVFDFFLLRTGWVDRIELEVVLRDELGNPVLAGHVSGVGVDAVSEPEQLDDLRREDVTLAALHDAAMKVSRALRLVADQRARKAVETLPRLRLPPGLAPLQIAVFQLAGEESSRHRRAEHLTDHLQEALGRLGPDVLVLPDAEVGRAVLAAKLGLTSMWSLDATQVRTLARLLPARLFVVGRMVQVAGTVEVEARVFDAGGRVVLEPKAHTTGLGALRVAAVDLARAIGAELESHPPKSD